MGEQSVALAKAVDYQSAGTVEFIVDRDRNFFFLEMNTRLQVEHPVTELITGIDLVEQMIRVAAGEKLAIAQSDIQLKGWAVESRLYAEDPYRNFLPSIGRLTRYRPPQEGTFGDVIVRNDTGVFEGAEISIHYDPMIAKLCTWAPNRADAIVAMSEALDGFVVDGIAHNIPFLATLMKHPRWREGRLSTGFIAEEFANGFQPVAPTAQESTQLAAIAASAWLIGQKRRQAMSGQMRASDFAVAPEWEVKLEKDYLPLTVSNVVGGENFSADMEIAGAASLHVTTSWHPGDAVWRGLIGDVKVTAQIRMAGNAVRIDWQGLSVHAHLMRPHIAALDRLMPEKIAPDTSRLLLCPMPGLVVSVSVTEGQDVKAGETLAIVEAMKMENVLRAERDLVVKKIHAKAGDSLAVDAVIMDFE
jgi:propionyl-CoA carboxylase alpha chain